MRHHNFDPSAFLHTPESLEYTVTHIFLPEELPKESKYTPEKDLSLVRAACAAAHAYGALCGTSEPQWHRITKMLDNLQASVQCEHLDMDLVISQLRTVRTGDILAFRDLPHGLAIVLTRGEDRTLFESFEISPRADAVDGTLGPLVCLYPDSAVELPNTMFDDERTLHEIFSFAICPFVSPRNAQHATLLSFAPSRDVDRNIDFPQIVKHIRSEVRQSHNRTYPSEDVWRRSPLWLFIRVSAQMSLNHCLLGRASYKSFMLFVTCYIARDPNISTLSNSLLDLISLKILRRLGKLGSSIPDWLSEIALKTCSGLREIADDRRRKLSTRSSPFRNPSQDELTRDIQLSLERSREHIHDALANRIHKSVDTPFHPTHQPRGDIIDFLSLGVDVFNKAYDFDPEVTLHDIEQAVEQGLDDWVACVTNVDEACAQLEILMDRYMMVDYETYSSAEDRSIVLLTGVELFVALDILVVAKVPLLADYSPEIPLAFLEKLLLRRTSSFHRLSRIYQYLSARHFQSRPGWSILSDEFTDDSFPARYYDQSPHLQQLKLSIEEDAEAAGTFQSPLPPLPLLAKIVVFELQCPTCVRIWRSAAARTLFYFRPNLLRGYNFEDEEKLLEHVDTLQRYFIERDGPPLFVQIRSAYFYPEKLTTRHRVASLRYVARYPNRLLPGPPTDEEKQYFFSAWPLFTGDEWIPLDLSKCHGETFEFPLREYLDTSHTTNNVLAAQADRPIDLSPDEFVTLGQLRSGGLTQWVNILQGLRNRSLNLRRPDVHVLLSHMAYQAGPFDLETGAWIWHQELQDSSFCNVLLDELSDILLGVGAGAVNAIMMNTVSLLLTRVLASSPSEYISERAIALLQPVRRRTFSWVQELSYNLAKAPMSRERLDLLWEMAIACRSTFDVDPAAAGLCKLFPTAEDVDAALSCSLFVYALYPNYSDIYSKTLFGRNRRIAFTIEGILRDEILADASNYSIDLAICRISPSHKPHVHRWEPLQYPNTRWITCRTDVADAQPSHIVHLNLLNGELRLGGQPVGGLPRAIRDDIECNQIFRDQGFFVVPSNLPGMDFTTLAATSTYKVHFSLQGSSLVVQAQSNHSKDVLQLIPSKELSGDLPTALIDGHVHWLNLLTRTIEIRPFGRPWHRSPEDWKIECRAGRYRAHSGQETLVDIRSSTWEMISRCFECLRPSGSSLENMLITVLPNDSLASSPVLRLCVALPRYGLSFFVNERRELESNDFKDMVYDKNQCIGTLYGLEHLLVLRQNAHLPTELILRRVLIPYGIPRVRQDSHQVWISEPIEGSTALPGEPLYYAYNVDTELGCLTGNGNLLSMQYLAELHATTSWDTKLDPLTGKTGVQAAYFILQSAGCRSIMKHKSLTDRFNYPLKVAGSAPRRQFLSAWYEERHSWKRVSKSIGREGRKGDYLPHTPEECGLPAIRNTDLCHQTGLITLEQLFSSRPPPMLPPRNVLFYDSHKMPSDDIPKLSRLFTALGPTDKSSSPFQREYLTRLNASACATRIEFRISLGSAGKDLIDTLEKHYLQCRASYLDALGVLKDSLGPMINPYHQALSQSGQWPPISADRLLSCLGSTSPINLSSQWKHCLVSFALLLLDLQRARRLLRFALDCPEEFSKEVENVGCDGWCPEEYPDWLLIQIQGNFLIRRSQAEIAMEMMYPKSGRNTVMQVNMGQGKSSVIIPIVSAALADGKQLARVIVPKALTNQMFDILVARLGGLADRPIYYLPFTRSPEYDCEGRVISLQVDDLRGLMSACVAERGILLVQPEHVASLKLMSIEEQISKASLKPTRGSFWGFQKSFYEYAAAPWLLKLLPGEMFRWLNESANCSSIRDATRADEDAELSGPAQHTLDSTASKWLSLQRWMDSHVRDILDESDEILRPQFQLIYTIGLKQHLDGYPDRWTISQQVLRLAKESSLTLSKNYPDSIEYRSGLSGSFPYIRFVPDSGIGLRLVSLIVKKIMTGQLPGFDFRGASQEVQDAIRSFISDEDILQLPDTAKRIEEYVKNSDQSYTWCGLLLLRGLLASKILLFALMERRWRVDYGLVLRPQYFLDIPPDPTMLAVPYLAKDTPSPNTQFGHPDITIILTCLSYYYSGLSRRQLKTSFEILLDEDDPFMEYALWVEDYDEELIPDPLRKLSQINLNSSEQWDKIIFPLFSRNQAAIDFYLSRVVFPKEAQEFPWKLRVSSWDLAEERDRVITGFSGTNDSGWLLPMSVVQHEFDQQQGTNARVLAYLLQPENDFYAVTHQNGEQWSTRKFLDTIALQKPQVRVLLDVGAQVLDLSNDQVARTWLHMDRNIAGAVYFSEDELMVLDRSETSKPLSSSPLSQQLDRCVVYLDHAHTRGTDIRVPIGSRAAVTLGPKVTKDRLVQGCMRMRKLGHGHSIIFFAPPEVDLSIRSLTAKQDPNTPVTAVDVLCWAIHETWNDIQHWAPHWAQHGMDYKSKREAWSRFCKNNLTSEQLADAWLQPERKSLEDLYAPRGDGSASITLSALDPGIRQRCKDLGILSLPAAQMDEEQEREVNKEQEREREAERPPRAEPAKHVLHSDVVAFVETGAVPQLHSNSAFRPIFTTLEPSSAATREADVWSPYILATVDFCNTIEPESTEGSIDQYLRPVQFVLSNKRPGCERVLVLVSPFEADCLIPSIRASDYVHLHIYAPRLSKRMKPADDLKLYTIPSLPHDWTPPWALIDQLNVFAGQLYLRDYRSYLRLCQFLGIPTNEVPSDGIMRRNLFKVPGSFGKNEITFSNSPLPFVTALLAIRNRGRPFGHTHMGKILQGRRLTASDFEVVASSHAAT